LLHLASIYGLRPLVIHFDNGWNGSEAKQNIDVMIKGTGFDFINYSFDFAELNRINKAFLLAGLPDADIPNDIAMHSIWNEFADKFKIKYILNGHNFRYEGSIPKGWTRMDSKYIESVCKKQGVKIKSYPLFTIKNQIKYALKGIKSIRLLAYVHHDKAQKKKMLTDTYGWVDYGANHGENIYTEFVGKYLLPKKFGINKNIIYLSAMVRSGYLTKYEAEQKLLEVSEIAPEKLAMIESKLNINIAEIMAIPKGDRNDYDSYKETFQRYRFLFWLGAKFGFFPYTFYTKYCK
jgi:hypothetical protein